MGAHDLGSLITLRAKALDEPFSKMKINMKSLPQMVTGSLLGLAMDSGVLEITHAFPSPDNGKDDEIRSMNYSTCFG